MPTRAVAVNGRGDYFTDNAEPSLYKEGVTTGHGATYTVEGTV